MLSATPESLLFLWEQGARRHPLDRALLMLSMALPDTPAARLADVPLGACNTALMNLRRAFYGSRLPAWLDCSKCGERMEFELDAAQLPPANAEPVDSIEVDSHPFRLPTSRDLANLASLPAADAGRYLLSECALEAGALPREPAALTELLAAVETALEQADPWLQIELEVRCPACGGEDTASFDIAGYLWREIERGAQHLLDDVHKLARAYGWSEAQILALGAVRRDAYLERIVS